MRFLASHFPTAKLLQIYARHATKTGAISIQSSNAVASLIIQMIIPHGDHPLSLEIDSGARSFLLNGDGLA